MTKFEQIISMSELSSECLSNLICSDISMIRVENFIQPELVAKIAAAVEKSQNEFEDYAYFAERGNKVSYKNLGVKRLGPSYNTTYQTETNSEEFKKYVNESLKNTRRLRSVCHPFLSPLDRLRLEFDEIWPTGAQIARFRNVTLNVGCVRLMTAEESKLSEVPHIDKLPEFAGNIHRQFAANIYIILPKDGGGLKLWCNGMDASKEPASIVIKPKVGELVLFPTRIPHAIDRFDSGIRVSVQTFFGTNEQNGIVFWT